MLQKRLDWLLTTMNESSRVIIAMTLNEQKMNGEGLVNSKSTASDGKIQSDKAHVNIRSSIRDSMHGTVETEYVGVQFDQHRILALDHESTQIIPISQMMSWYGEADGGGTCREDFGNNLIKKWRGMKETYCGARGPTINGESSIDCYLIHQTRHHGAGDNLCVMKNIAVNMGTLLHRILTHCCRYLTSILTA